MEIKIIGDNIEVTEAISEYILKRIHSLNLPLNLMNMEFRIGKEHLVQYVKFFSHNGKKDVIIKQTDSDVYYAVDLLIERIKKSFRRTKEKNDVSTKRNRRIITKRNFNNLLDENDNENFSDDIDN